MNSQRISWFWPLSFLAALGQVLLLLTHNPSGPALARFALAIWTLWLPGVWLGNLLTKLDTGLPARLALQAACAMAFSYLLLLVRAGGVLPVESLPLLISGVSLVIGSVFVLLPGNRGGTRRPARWETREMRRAGPQVMAPFLTLVFGVALVSLGAGSPLSLRPDGPDQITATRLSGESTHGFVPAPYHEDDGVADRDPHRSLAHGLIDLIARLSNLPQDRVWDLFPGVVAPLLLLAVFSLGRSIFRDETLAAASAVVYLLLTTAGFSNHALLLSPYPDHLGQIPYWVAVGLFVEGLDRPHARGGLAFGLAAAAAVGTHLGFGLLLLVVALAVGTYTWMSVDRFVEGMPLLLVLWAPALVLVGAYLLFCRVTLGRFDPFGVPAQGMWVLGSNRWTLWAAEYPVGVRVAAIVGAVGAFVLLRRAWHRVSFYYLVSLTALGVFLGWNPWVTPTVEKHVGSLVHFLPWLVPLPFALVAEGEWALRGLARSRGHTWLRLLTAGAVAGALVWVTAGGLIHFAYTPSRVAAQRSAGPEAQRPLAEAVSARFPGHPVVLSDPPTTAALCAYVPLRSAYLPASLAGGRAETLRRSLAAREAFRLPEPEAPPGRATDALLRFLRAYPVQVIVIPRIPAGKVPAGDWSFTATQIQWWQERLRADSTRYHEISLDGQGYAFQVASPGPGPGPEVWLSASPGPLRPPASVRFPSPTPVAVTVDTARVRAGELLTVRSRWERPASSGNLDPRGYRVRVELCALPSGPPSWTAPLRNRWRTLTDFLAGRCQASATEAPLQDGRPVPRWPARGEQDIRLALPPSLAPGTYEVRVAALPGPVSFDHTKRSASFLSPGASPVTVQVLPAKR